MSDSFDLDSILQISLERLERGESIQDCLARFPKQAAELAPLLETVVALRSLATPPARSEAARAAARARFLFAIERRQAQWAARAQAPWLGWREGLSRLLGHPLLRQWAPVLSGLFLAFLLINGTMKASATSLPGDWLYPVKLAAEQMQLLIVGDISQRTILKEEFQARRRTEAKSLVERGRRARVAFSGVIEGVTPGALRIAGLTIRLGYETRVWGAPRTGAMAQVTAISQSFGELVALEIEVFEPPTPTPMPTAALGLTATPASQPTPARAIGPRVQIPQRRIRRAPVIIPTRSPRPVRPAPTPLPARLSPTAVAPTLPPEGSAITATPAPPPEGALTVTPSLTGEPALPTPMPTGMTPEPTEAGPVEAPATPAPPEGTPVPVTAEPAGTPTAPSEAAPVPTEAGPAETPIVPSPPEASPAPPPPEATPEPAPASPPTATPVSEAPTSAPPLTAPPLPPTQPPMEPPPPPPEPGEELPTPPPPSDGASIGSPQTGLWGGGPPGPRKALPLRQQT